MGAALDDAAAFEHDDLVGHAHGREAVRDQDRDPVARELAEVLEHLGLGARVHRRGRLVEHQDVGIGAHERARQRDLLPLPARQLAAVLEPLAELRVRSPRGSWSTNSAARPFAGRLAPARLVLEMRLVAGADVLADQQLVADEVLEDHADALAQRVLVPLRADRGPSSRMRPAVGLVQARQQLDQRGLARAVLADQRERAAGRQVQGDILRAPASVAPG